MRHWFNVYGTLRSKLSVFVAVDEDEDDSLQIFYERFEDTNLLVKRDQITMETIIGQGEGTLLYFY